jgi:hypothetical protein
MRTLSRKITKRTNHTKTLKKQKKNSLFSHLKTRSAVLVLIALVLGVSSVATYLMETGHAAASSSARITGISDPDLLTEPLATQQAQLADMKNNLGVTTVRVDANWGYVEYAQNQYNWTQYDQMVGAIRAEGLGIEFIIDGCPQWAATVPADVTESTDYVQPTSSAQFAAWGATVASRYGSGGVTSYEIWNEPNSAVFWLPQPNPAAYTADLKAAYTAIKAVEPSQTVISGGLAPEATDGTDINGITFLQDMYADGAKNYFNALGYHPYSFPALPNTYESWSGFSQLSETSPSIRSVMAANGDSAKQVWLTEVGWPTNTTSTTGLTGDDAQTDDISQIATFAGANSWVGPIYWFTYQDDNAGPFGLVGEKSSYYVYSGAQ